MMRPIAQKSRIDLRGARAPEDTVVFCDREAVSQILSNLLDNAIKYTPAGGRITVGAERRRGLMVNSSCAIPASGSRRTTCRASSSASTAWTRPAPGSWAAPAWASPSSNTWLPHTAARRAWKAASMKVHLLSFTLPDGSRTLAQQQLNLRIHRVLTAP